MNSEGSLMKNAEFYQTMGVKMLGMVFEEQDEAEF